MSPEDRGGGSNRCPGAIHQHQSGARHDDDVPPGGNTALSSTGQL